MATMNDENGGPDAFTFTNFMGVNWGGGRDAVWVYCFFFLLLLLDASYKSCYKTQTFLSLSSEVGCRGGGWSLVMWLVAGG